MSRFRKMARPAPNRACSLWRGCQFAYCAGWEKGYREDGTQQSAGFNDQNNQRPAWVGSLDENNYATRDMGRCLDEGLSDDKLSFADTANIYDCPNGFMSAFVLVRPESIQNSEQPVFSKEPDAGPPSGWGITVSFAGDPSPNGWHFQIHDGGIKEISIANTQNIAQTDVLLMTYNRAELVGFINGVRRGSIAATGAITNNDVAVILFGDGISSSGSNFQGNIGAAAFWNRPLTNSEIALLNTDPYIMWRNELHKEFMFGPGLFGSFQTFFLNFG